MRDWVVVYELYVCHNSEYRRYKRENREEMWLKERPSELA